jgi:sec-independent protein translocase protein TatA
MAPLLAFGLNYWEVLLILGVMLLLFGSSRLPTLMRSMGRSITEFKRGVREGAEAPDEALPENSKPEGA